MKVIGQIAGMYHWKHGMKGSGVYWLQQARDEIRLSRIALQLFEFIGKSVSDDSFKVPWILISFIIFFLFGTFYYLFLFILVLTHSSYYDVIM